MNTAPKSLVILKKRMQRGIAFFKFITLLPMIATGLLPFRTINDLNLPFMIVSFVLFSTIFLISVRHASLRLNCLCHVMSDDNTIYWVQINPLKRISPPKKKFSDYLNRNMIALHLHLYDGRTLELDLRHDDLTELTEWLKKQNESLFIGDFYRKSFIREDEATTSTGGRGRWVL
jgi:hypothetical protein